MHLGFCCYVEMYWQFYLPKEQQTVFDGACKSRAECWLFDWHFPSLYLSMRAVLPDNEASFNHPLFCFFLSADVHMIAPSV